ncbi:MAG: glycoside hydrolase family 3 protein [Clostridia bacterium]|nr:glycoside hydrolase family 3 protein [Clostridia bacterium]
MKLAGKRNFVIKRALVLLMSLFIIVHTGCAEKSEAVRTADVLPTNTPSQTMIFSEESSGVSATAHSTELFNETIKNTGKETENISDTESPAVTSEISATVPSSNAGSSASDDDSSATAAKATTENTTLKTSDAAKTAASSATKLAEPATAPAATYAPSPTGNPGGAKNEEITVQSIIDGMTLEEKAAQLFVVVPYAITDISSANAANEKYKSVFDEYPLGGFCYMGNSIVSETQVKEMLTKAQQYSYERVGVPLFTCIDEEGGKVARIGNSDIDVPSVGNMCDIGAAGDSATAADVGRTIGKYLSDFGFNVDFAPVADVLSNSENTVVKYRSFGSDTDLVSDMALSVMDGLEEYGVYGTLKHFPGHGATEGDTHEGYAYTLKTLEELERCELIPFANGIESGVEFIMIGHISLPNIIVDNTPASLSYEIITELLREKMGYDGIIITDALNMGAITEQYSSAEAAVNTLLAGADMILMPDDFYSAYEGVLDAVRKGTVSESRIDESLERILTVKLEMMGQ